MIKAEFSSWSIEAYTENLLPKLSSTQQQKIGNSTLQKMNSMKVLTCTEKTFLDKKLVSTVYIYVFGITNLIKLPTYFSWKK